MNDASDAGRHGAGASALVTSWAPFLLFAAGSAYCVFHHDPSRHELQAFLIARASSGLSSLFHNLAHEGHPGLWHLLLLAAVRLHDDPIVLNVLQALIAAATLSLIWLAAPFNVIEKALLSVSYYIAFEYALLAPGYGLGVVLFFAFIALRRSPWSWLALGLMANIAVHFMALAAVGGALLIYRRQRSRLGIAVFLALLAIAVITAYPAPDTIVATQPRGVALRALLSLARLSAALLPVNASLPLGLKWSQVCAACGGLAPLVLGLLVPALGAFSLRARPALRSTYLAACGALFLIGAAIYLGYDRHYGLAFVVLVGLHWMARDDKPQLAPSATFLCWLIVSAAAGAWSISGSLQADGSNGRAAAQWLSDHAEPTAVVAAYPGWMGIEISAYLRKPIYNLQAHRYQSFVSWNYAADVAPSRDDVRDWLETAPRTGPLYVVSDPTSLASSIERGAGERLGASGIRLKEAARFQAGGDGYVIYRARFGEP
ncbi:MAG: hypothetical protein ACLQME_13105 [Alphaproteobacteria bacterium]